MKTTKRSKMLISSIAMLLVALVALGSATYAWYTLNKTVTASPAVVTASAPEGLLIKNSSDSTWKASTTFVNLTDVDDLNPVSIVAGTDGTVTSAFKAEADAVGNYASTKTFDTVSSGTVGGLKYYVIDELQVKSTGKEAVNVQCAVKLNAAAANTFMTLAIVDTTAGSVLGYVNSDGTSTTAVTAAAGTTTSQTKTTATTSYQAIGSTVSYTQNDVHTIKVIAYADGQNSNCYTTNGEGAGTDASFNVVFTYDTIDNINA